MIDPLTGEFSIEEGLPLGKPGDQPYQWEELLEEKPSRRQAAIKYAETTRQTRALWGTKEEYEAEMGRRGLTGKVNALAKIGRVLGDEEGAHRRFRRDAFLRDRGYSEETIRSGLARAYQATEWELEPDDELGFDRHAKEEATLAERRANISMDAAKAGRTSILEAEDPDAEARRYSKIIADIDDPIARTEAARGFMAGQESVKEFRPFAKAGKEIYEAVTSGAFFNPEDISGDVLEQLSESSAEDLQRILGASLLVQNDREGGTPDAGFLEEAFRNLGRTIGGWWKSTGQFFGGRPIERDIERFMRAPDLYIAEADSDNITEAALAGRLFTKEKEGRGLRGASNRRELSDPEKELVFKTLKRIKGAIRAHRMAGTAREALMPLLDDNFWERSFKMGQDSGVHILTMLNPVTGGILATDFIARRDAELDLTAPNLPVVERQALATMSGTMETFVAKAQAATIFRGYPRLSRALENAGLNKFVDKMVRTAANLGTEIGQEFIEEQSLNHTLMVARIFDQSLPESQWVETAKAFHGHLGEMAVGMFPLVLLGTGASSKISPDLAAEIQPYLTFNLMRVAGYTPAEIDRVMAQDGEVAQVREAQRIQREKGPEAMREDISSEPEVVEGAKQELVQMVEEARQSAQEEVDPDVEGFPIGEGEVGVSAESATSQTRPRQPRTQAPLGLPEMSQEELAEHYKTKGDPEGMSAYDALTARHELRGMNRSEQLAYIKNAIGENMGKTARELASRMNNLWTAIKRNKTPGIKPVGKNSMWNHYLIGEDTHQKGADRHKAYATLPLDVVANLTGDQVLEFMTKLRDAGFNGQLKAPGIGSRFFYSFDNIVMHGATEADAKLAEKLASEHFKGARTQLGTDRAGKSHTEQLADDLEAALSDPTAEQARAESHIRSDDNYNGEQEESGPGAAAVSEFRENWRIRNAATRFGSVEEVKQATGIDPEDELNMQRRVISSYEPIKNDDTVADMLETIDENGLINSAMAFLDSKAVIDGEVMDIHQDLGSAQRITLGQLLLDKLSKAHTVAKMAGSEETVTQLNQLAHDIAFDLVRMGTDLGQGVQAFRIWSYLHPEMIVEKMDAKLKEKATADGRLNEGSEEEVEVAAGELEEASAELEKAIEEEEEQEREVAKWIEEIDKNVRGRQTAEGRELRNEPPETRPTEETVDIKALVRIYGRGGAMTEQWLEQEFLRAGYSPEEAAEGVLRAGNLRAANTAKRSAQAKRAFLKTMATRRTLEISRLHKAMRKRWEAAERFVTDIWEKSPPPQTPTTNKVRPSDVVKEFIDGTGARTPEVLADQLRSFEVDGKPMFTEAQIQEATLRAEMERKDRREGAEMKALRKAAKAYIQGLVDMMGREGFRKAFQGTRQGGALETYAEVRARIDSKIDEITQYNDLFAVLMASPGLTVGQRSKLLDMSRAAREAPDGFMRAAAAQRMVNYMGQVEGIPFWDKATAYWYANILSGPNTQMVNVWGSGTHLIARVVAAMPVNLLRGGGADNTAMIKGMIRAFPEAWNEAKDALIDGRAITKAEVKWNTTAEPLETLGGHAWTGDWKATASNFYSMWKYVFRALQAGDGFFYRTAYEGRAYMAASRVARSETRTKQGYARLLSEYLHDSTNEADRALDVAKEEVEASFADESEASKERMARRRAFEILDQMRDDRLREEARNFGLLVTYTNKPEGFMGQLAKGFNQINRTTVFQLKWLKKYFPEKFHDSLDGAGSIPVTRWFVPFVNIVANVGSSSMSFTPIGVLRGMKGGHLTGDTNTAWDSQRRMEEASAGMIGTTLTYAAAKFFGQFLDDDDPLFAIYGSGPTDSGKRSQMYNRGWKPFTIKIGNTYIKYNETPLAIPFGLIGAIHDLERFEGGPDEDQVKRILTYMALSAEAMAEPSFLKSASNMMKVFVGEKKIAGKFYAQIGMTAGGFVPAKGLMRDILERPFDGEIIETDSMWAAFIKGVPFVQRVGTQPMLNGFGEPIYRRGWDQVPGFSRMISTDPGNEDWKWLSQNGLWLSQPDTQIRVTVAYPTKSEKRKVEQTREQRMQDMGRMAFDVLTAEEAYELHQITGPQFRAMIRTLRNEYPAVNPEDRESLQDEIYQRSKEIRREARVELFKKYYPEIWGP